MSSRLCYSLPSETWDRVFSCLSPHDLFSASIVSRTWLGIALPHLYSFIRVDENTDVESLRTRIKANDRSSISLAKYVRGLEIWNILPSNVSYLDDILPVLSSLRHFSWRNASLPRDIATITILQTECPKLTSVDLIIIDEYPQDWDVDHTAVMFQFRGLQYLSLDVDKVAEFEEERAHQYATLLRACPDLKALELGLSTNSMYYSWSFSGVCAKLQDVTFESLRSIRLHGTLVSTPEDDGDEPVRSFFARHPGLQEISFMSHIPSDLSHNFRDISGAFSSLVSFEGPASMCKSVILSEAASQIESLRIVDVDDETDEDNSKAGTWGNIHVFQRMSSLRKLVVKFTEDGLDDDNQIIRSLFNSPSLSLEVVEIRSGYTLLPVEDLLHALQFLPKLRRLELTLYVERCLVVNPEMPNWVECMRRFELICPRLESIFSSYHGKVMRGGNVTN